MIEDLLKAMEDYCDSVDNHCANCALRLPVGIRLEKPPKTFYPEAYPQYTPCFRRVIKHAAMKANPYD